MNYVRKLKRTLPILGSIAIIAVLMVLLGVIPAGATTKVPVQEKEMVPNSPDAVTIPAMINYQGYLTDSTGDPINGTLDITFSIYNTATGGSTVWTETQSSVSVNDGVFNVMLGSVTPITTDHLTGESYLGVQVGSDPEMTPRQRLGSVPYSLRADTANNAKQLIQDFVVASGESVTAGDVVRFINGYVQKGFVAGDSITYGPEYEFNSVTTHHISAAALSSTKFVVAYQDVGNSDYGTAVIGDVSGTTITYGSEYVFNSAETRYISAVALSSTKFVVTYQDVGNSDYGTAVIGDVSGTTITYGSEYEFNLAYTYYISAAALSATKFVVAYSDVGDPNYGTATIGDVSGTTITYGSEYEFNSVTTHQISAVALSATKFVVTYSDVGNSYYGTAVIGDVVGTSISYGPEYEFNSGSTYYISAAALSVNKFVVAYVDVVNFDYGTAVIGDVSGCVITYGSGAVFNSATTYYISAAALSATKFVVTYRDDGNSYYGTAVIGDVVGTSISYGPEYEFNSGSTDLISAAALSVNKFVVAYVDVGNSSYGTAIIGDAVHDSVVGITKESGTAGETVEVIIGGVSDVHSGLTPGAIYYADTSGDLTTEETDYRVGLAISSTEILLDSDRDNFDQFFGDMVFENNFRITESATYEGLVLKNQLNREILTITEDGNLNVCGNVASQGLSTALVKVTEAYTIGDYDSIIVCDASSGAFTVTLPTAVGITGRQYTVKKTDSTGNAVTLESWGTEMIDGSSGYYLDIQWKYITIVSDGANWLIVANN